MKKRVLIPRTRVDEGIDIDKNRSTVAFNPSHQNYVDTNDPWNPKPIYNEVDGYNVISIFTRKMTDDKQDGNPLIYALKGKYWRFKNPQYDIMALLRRFVAVTKELKEKFDIIITIPSSNRLNTEILHKITRIIPHEMSFENFFEKYTANEVYELFLNTEWLKREYPNDEIRGKINGSIYKSICRMNLPKEKGGNDGIFSYKFLKPQKLRYAIIKSMSINAEFADKEKLVDDDLTLEKTITGKNVLIIDDTVTSGKTISDAAEAFKETYTPSSITFLTLLSPLTRC